MGWTLGVLRYILFAFLCLGLLFSTELISAQNIFYHLLGQGPRFSITGITSTNTQDSTIDARLNYDTRPVVAWQAMPGASSYDVAIYADDKTTVICTSQNTTSLSYDFSSCGLTLGTYYRVHLQARQGVDTFFPENLWYRFYVNRQPTITSLGPWYILNTSGGCFDINALYSAPPGVGVASDVDSGQTLTFSNVGASTIGNTITNYSTYVRYTNTAKNGIDVFAFTVSDGNGAAVSGSITIFNMSAYTWTGDAGSNTFETAANWCGSINANKTGCAGAGSSPINTTDVVIDNRCVSSFCAPVTTSNDSAVKSITLDWHSFTVGNGLNFKSDYVYQNGGTFNAGNLTYTIQNDGAGVGLRILGGTFNAPSGTLVFNNTAQTNYWRPIHIYTPGVFNHNNGTVRVAANSVDQAGSYTCNNLSGTNLCKNHVAFATPSQLTFYDLEYAQYDDGIADSVTYFGPVLATSSSGTTGGGKIVVERNFSHGVGAAGITIPFISLSGDYELQGDYNVNLEATNLTYGFQGSYANLKFNGTGTQNISINGGQSTHANVTVDKPASSLVLQTNYDIKQVNDFTFGLSQGNLTITSGTLDMNGFDLTVGNSVTNNGTLTRGVSPTCGTLTYASFSGNADICP